MNWRDYISSDPEICHGRARITGTWVMVTVILDSLAEGLEVAEITTHYPTVSKDAVRAALLYAAELAKERIMPLEVWGSKVIGCRRVTISQQGYNDIMADETKRIEGDAVWESAQNPAAR